jgi:uncharacterized protein (DUF58 family)
VKPVFKIFYRIYRVVSWLRYHIPRRFTRAGLALAGGLILAAMTGLDTDNSIAYQIFALLFFLLVIPVPFLFAFSAPFSAVRRLPRFGTAGQPFSYRVLITNLTARNQDGLMLLENLSDPRPPFDEWLAVQLADERRARSFRFSQRRRTNPFRRATVKEVAAPALLPNQEIETSLELTPLRRGVLRFAGLTLARPDPFGFLSAFSNCALPQSMLILPKRYPLPPVALPGTTKYQEGGVAFASNVGLSEEFVSLRDYRRGDPLRHIHWRSWAKVGKPIVREFEDEFFTRHALVLDTFTDDPHSEIFEEAVSVAASFASTVLTQESLLDLLFVGPQAFCFTAGRGVAHTDQMLEILASVRACVDRSFRAIETLVLDHASSVSGCICVFLAWDEARRDLVRKLKMLGVPVLVLVITEPGRDRPLEPGPMQDELDRFHHLEAGRMEEGLARLR